MQGLHGERVAAVQILAESAEEEEKKRIAGSLFSLATGKSLLYQAATSYFLQSFVTQTISLKLQNYFYHRLMAIIPDPTHGEKPTTFQGINNDRMSIDIEMNFEAVGPSALTIEDTANSSHAGGYTATIPFDPVTGDTITPSPEVTTDPLELETDSEASRCFASRWPTIWVYTATPVNGKFGELDGLALASGTEASRGPWSAARWRSSSTDVLSSEAAVRTQKQPEGCQREEWKFRHGYFPRESLLPATIEFDAKDSVLTA
ncbi:hypothetical protein BZA05DRAFT_452118 [Tricharina praecox]|uniref:uncharacterized protein n=1 Tax=Tricharina praecox TaxID=43433 RepID=UPI00221E40B6|nr:uncharacterized protein BZA05DRAFT_452118 [Tricharina praecox]KAI5852171.1 hypothetical protein BZA05DRAFT_452118 [Tricharina praecox]